MTTQETGSSERLLGRFDVAPEAEALWRALLATPHGEVANLAQHAGLGLDAVASATKTLVDARLVRGSSNPLGVIAIDPTLAIGTHIALEERQLAERVEGLAALRAQIPEIAAVYEQGRAASGEEPGFEVIVGLDAIRHQLYLAAERETTENRNLTPARSVEAFEHARSADFKALDRGVQMRTILNTSGLSDPNIYRELQERSVRGELVRVMPETPTQLLIFDRDLAVLPVDPNHSALGAIFIRVQSLVEILIYMFDRLWTEADPVFTNSADSDAPTNRERRVLELIAVGTKDERIARSLGVGVRTVRRDIAELKKALGVTSRTEIPAAAIRNGWL